MWIVAFEVNKLRFPSYRYPNCIKPKKTNLFCQLPVRTGLQKKGVSIIIIFILNLLLYSPVFIPILVCPLTVPDSRHPLELFFFYLNIIVSFSFSAYSLPFYPYTKTAQKNCLPSSIIVKTTSPKFP